MIGGEAHARLDSSEPIGTCWGRSLSSCNTKLISGKTSVDADWAGCVKTHRNPPDEESGFTFARSARDPKFSTTVACSSAESEYYSLSSGECSHQWVGPGIRRIHISTDASVAKPMSQRTSVPTRAKHMGVRIPCLQQLGRNKSHHPNEDLHA